MKTLHIVKPETSDLNFTYVIERIVEFAEKNKCFPELITTRPKNYVKILCLYSPDNLRKRPTVLGIPLEIAYADDTPESTPV